MSTPAVAAPQRQQQPNSERDLVFCHECQEEWYRDEGGLTCVRCGSDFCEIIEQNHDPREELLHDDEHDHPPNPFADFLGALLQPPPGAGYDHQHTESRGRSPGAQETQTRTLSPGGTTVVSILGPGITIRQTFSSSIGPGGLRAGSASRSSSSGPGRTENDHMHPNEDQMRVDLFGILRNIMGEETFMRMGAGGEGQQQQQPGSGHRLGGDAYPTPAEAGSGPPPPRQTTFTAFYPPGARQGGEPVSDIGNFLFDIFGPGGVQQGGLFGIPFPLLRGASGDYVTSREELDRVISQLMEQHQGNAPPPAPREVIDKLPRVKVTEEQAAEGIDCAVCKDDLNPGEEVAKMPCKHIYHFECVSKWLEAHNTCPICRTPLEVPEGSQNQNRNQQNQEPQSPPGSWNFSNSPQSQDQQQQQSQNQQYNQDQHSQTHTWSWSGSLNLPNLPHIPLPHIPNPLSSHHDSSSSNNQNQSQPQNNNSDSYNNNHGGDGTNDNSGGPRATFANLFRRATGGGSGAGNNNH